MEETKSTLVGIFFILLGSFFIYSDKVDVHNNNYVLYACLGLMVFGVYLLFTTKLNRTKHFEGLVKIVKRKLSRRRFD